MNNPFVYGEVVPGEAFVDREVELDRLVTDLTSAQKVFLISPRRYGKSSLIRQALATLARRGALTVEVTVSSYSSYVSFLEGYARALASVETRWERARTWLLEAITSTRPAARSCTRFVSVVEAIVETRSDSRGGRDPSRTPPGPRHPPWRRSSRDRRRAERIRMRARMRRRPGPYTSAARPPPPQSPRQPRSPRRPRPPRSPACS